MTDLLDFIQNEISLNNEEKDFVKSVFKPLIVNKKNQILKQKLVADKLFFIQKGLVRVYHISEEGNEMTSEIMTAPSFVTCFESFRKRTPSTVIVETVTDCELQMVLEKDYLKLFEKVQNWQTFCTSVYDNYLFRNSKRLNALKNLSAKERYLDFVESNKQIVNNIPIKHLASYLGIKPQSLSRIRAEVFSN